MTPSERESSEGWWCHLKCSWDEKKM